MCKIWLYAFYMGEKIWLQKDNENSKENGVCLLSKEWLNMDELDELMVLLCHELDTIKCHIRTDPEKAEEIATKLISIIQETLNKEE